jgi:murein DD-endopeptidase MepM/ murein hydrolase activator NlpD
MPLPRKITILSALMGANLLLVVLLTDLGRAAPAPGTADLAGAGRAPDGDVISYTHLLYEAIQPDEFGGGPWEVGDDSLTPQQEEAIQAAIDANIELLLAQGKLAPAAPTAVSLQWPLKASERLSDPGHYGITGFVDHEPAYGHVRDYQCGNRSYDVPGYNHKGVDIYLWPFPWRKMDEDAVAVVAAAPGVIVLKQDGYDDRSCRFNSNPWNAVYIRHSDNSVAWYGHLKRNSVTTKPVGALVATGEYLGIVGSSGNSTGPHLHLELRGPSNQLLDPYQGSCNLLNANSWWVTQSPYYEPAVNKVTTGGDSVSMPACPAAEDGNIEDSFAAGAKVYFTAYYRDQLAGLPSQYTIYRPNGSIFQQWTHQITPAHYSVSWWWWSYTLPVNAPVGSWRFRVEFNHEVHETYFNVGVPTAVTVTAPTTGQQWRQGSNHTITWNDNLGGNLRLELWREGVFHRVIARSTASNGQFEWAIPRDLPLGNAYQLRAVNLANEAVYSDSGYFAIVGPVVRLISPEGGEVWTVGDPVTITWTAGFTAPLRLTLEQTGQPMLDIVTATNSSEIYTWTVPLTLTSGTTYGVRITDSASNISVASNRSFAIWNPAADPLWLLQPNGGEFWEIGTTQTIRWLSVFTDTVRLELQRGVMTTAVLTSTSSLTNTFTWAIPLSQTLASDYRVHVARLADELSHDRSDTPFTIWNPLKLYLPLLRNSD